MLLRLVLAFTSTKGISFVLLGLVLAGALVLSLCGGGIDRAELIIAKNIAGEMGIIPLRFNGDQVKFTEDTMSLADYASLRPIDSSMNDDGITPRPTEDYSPFEHYSSSIQ